MPEEKTGRLEDFEEMMEEMDEPQAVSLAEETYAEKRKPDRVEFSNSSKLSK